MYSLYYLLESVIDLSASLSVLTTFLIASMKQTSKKQPKKGKIHFGLCFKRIHQGGKAWRQSQLTPAAEEICSYLSRPEDKGNTSPRLPLSFFPYSVQDSSLWGYAAHIRDMS